MGKINLIVASNPLYRRIVISVFQVGKLFFEKIHHFPDTYARWCILHVDAFKVPIRVNIKIAPLNHLEVCLPNKSAQCLVLFLAIGHARKDKVINAGPPTMTADNPDAFDHILEGIVVGKVIRFIEPFLCRVDACPDRVEASIT